ncbi:MAG TPA: MOSC domain-containing protein [Candidatus Eisenbacteria bacterium]|jgi:MOSC domain-containing protein YiiM
MAVSTLGTVVSVRIGRARSHPSPDWDRGAAREWRTAYWKDEATGAVRIGTLGLEGDEQADRRVHGGAHMAVLMYAETHYALWRTLPGLAGMGTGGFGENLTLDGADERELCIGDVLEVGGAELEISSPRGPCANISRRWDAPWLLERVVELRRTGWYLRVRREGPVARGDGVRLLQRPHTGWTIERLLRLRYVTPRAIDELAEASSLGALAPEWQKRFAKLASQG